MAATLAGSANLVMWPPFRETVTAAMVFTAVAVGNELVTDPSSETQRRRHALSANVLREQDKWAGNFVWAVATQTNITFTSTDAEIKNTVSAVWNAIAGVEPTA